MKKISIKSLSLTIIMLLISFCLPADAQIRYSETDTIDGITIMYRWQRSNIFKQDSRTILNLRLINTNDHPVNISFAVGFYKSAILVHESEDINKCFAPGQSKRGGPAGLRFQSEEITIEDIESDIFDWGFTYFDVEKTDECP